MGHQTMNHENGHGDLYGTILSIVLFFIAHFTLSDVAAFFAILAGASSAAYNIWRFYTEYKKRKIKSNE
jgi:hypothetical protein